MSHTKEPWRLILSARSPADNRCVVALVTRGDRYIPVVSQHPVFPDEEGANAHLIGAAPELKTELIQARSDVKNLLAILDGQVKITESSLDDEDAAIVTQTRQAYAVESPAIAKTEGRT
jgi:hypothetical protein